MTDKGRESILVIEIPQKDQNLERVHENDLKGIAIKKIGGFYYYYLQSLLQ